MRIRDEKYTNNVKITHAGDCFAIFNINDGLQGAQTTNSAPSWNTTKISEGEYKA